MAETNSVRVSNGVSPAAHKPNDRAEASRVLVGLTREIDVMEATIVEALRLQTGQLSGYAAQSAKAVICLSSLPISLPISVSVQRMCSRPSGMPLRWEA